MSLTIFPFVEMDTSAACIHMQVRQRSFQIRWIDATPAVKLERLILLFVVNVLTCFRSSKTVTGTIFTLEAWRLQNLSHPMTRLFIVSKPLCWKHVLILREYMLDI
jgi:hypothetical protein